MTPVISVQGLSLKAGPLQILQNLSLDAAPGEFLAIVGESGSGKTMAARAVIRLLPPGVTQTAGRILLEGRDISALGDAEFRKLRGPGVGMVFQEPMASLNPAMSIGAQMAEGLARHFGLKPEEIRARSLAMLQRIGIADPERSLKAFPHEFSGGMRQRIMLASVMLLRPKLLIADEPTTALDTLTQREVLDLMTELARDGGAAVLLITHNLGLVGRYASRALVLEKGLTVETGEARSILTAPREPYTQRLVAALPTRSTRPPVPADGAPLIAVRDLVVTHRSAASLFRARSEKRAVDGVSLEIHPREAVAVVGGSGSGKTTLGRAILGLIPSEAGQIQFNGAPLIGADKATRRGFTLAAQLVFQDPFSSLDPRMRIDAILEEPLRHLPDLTPTQKARRVDQGLEEVGLGGLGRRFPHELSGGQRQRVAIARALVRRPAFVVADEPVSALDMTIQAQILDLFRSLQDEYGFACLFISHDLGAIERIADRIIVMSEGKIVEEGARDAIFDQPKHAYTKALLAATPRLQPAAA